MIWLSAAWTFLKSPLGRYLALGVGVLLAVLWLRGHWIGVGVDREQKAEQARAAQARKRVARREEKAQAVTADVSQKLEKTRVEIQYRTRTLVEKVPVYVPAAADARCVVPVGFVQLYNAAARGDSASLPAAPSGPFDAPSSVALSAVLDVDVANLGTAHDYRAEAQAWREWYVRQRAEWEKR